MTETEDMVWRVIRDRFLPRLEEMEKRLGKVADCHAHYMQHDKELIRLVEDVRALRESFISHNARCPGDEIASMRKALIGVILAFAMQMTFFILNAILK